MDKEIGWDRTSQAKACLPLKWFYRLRDSQTSFPRAKCGPRKKHAQALARWSKQSEDWMLMQAQK